MQDKTKDKEVKLKKEQKLAKKEKLLQDMLKTSEV
jgi:hypothetical protein